MNIKRLMRQRNIAGISALVLLVGASVSAVAASSTYVCVNKASKVVYFKAKCSSGESRVAISTAATNGINGQNGVNGNNGDSAYDLWLKAGNTGTTADFLKSLKGLDGMPGANGSSANLLFFQRLENGLGCEEKWRMVSNAIYANNPSDIARQVAAAGCPQPDWAIQPFQLPDANQLTLASSSYGTPVLTARQVRRNNTNVDNPYAPQLVSVPFTAVVSVQAPTGWALCQNADPQISFVGGSGYPKLFYYGSDAMDYSTSIANNQATVSSALTFNSSDSLRFANYLSVYVEVCGPDTSTPSGLGKKTISAELRMPPVNP
jgi:hypothetical protein